MFRRSILAYVAKEWERAGRLAVGRWAELLTCPPLNAASFGPMKLEGRKVLYFKLHGLLSQPFWYAAHGVSIGDTALSATQILRADLGGALVVAANCFARGGPMEAALLEAGASAVFGDHDEAYGRAHSLRETDLLCKLLIDRLKRGWQAMDALRGARIEYEAKSRMDGRWTEEEAATLRDFDMSGAPEARVRRFLW